MLTRHKALPCTSAEERKVEAKEITNLHELRLLEGKMRR